MSRRHTILAGAVTLALLVAGGPAAAASPDLAGADDTGGVLSVEAAAADDLAPVAGSAAADAVLTSGETLGPGQALVSASGRYATVVSEEGELLVVLQPTRFAPDPVVLFVLAVGQPGASLTLNTDGSLVLYEPDGGVAKNYGTYGSGATQLVMQDDRNLVLYTSGGSVIITFDTRTLPSMVPGQALLSGDQLLAEDGSTLVMQTDGNLVLYQEGAVRFQSRTRSDANAGADAVLQTDGNFVVYAGNRPVFGTGTRTTQEAAQLLELVLGTGQFSVLDLSGDRYESRYGSAWTSSTVTPRQTLLRGDERRSADGRSVLRFQTDGNLVQYRDGRAVFQTGTRGPVAGWAVMQPDGNFVVYGAELAGDTRALFQTRTDGTPGATVVVPDGSATVQVRSPGGRVLYPR